MFDADIDDIIETYYPIVLNRVHSQVPEDAAEDVTQSIFENLVKSIGSFNGASEFSTWFYRLERNRVADYFRKEYKHRQKYQSETDPSGIYWRGSENTGLVLQDLMSRLPSHYAEIIRMRHIDGYSFVEIAKIKGVGYEGVRSLHRRAILAARKLWIPCED